MFAQSHSPEIAGDPDRRFAVFQMRDPDVKQITVFHYLGFGTDRGKTDSTYMSAAAVKELYFANGRLDAVIYPRALHTLTRQVLRLSRSGSGKRLQSFLARRS